MTSVELDRLYAQRILEDRNRGPMIWFIYL
jgi:hypothetical protein